MTCGIYEIKNKRDGTVYIGQSMNIEKRWRAHKYMNPLNTGNNLKPTLELYNENPNLVEFNVILYIYPEMYSSEDELKFILSVHEKHELSLIGGYTSPEVINERPVIIPAVHPTILVGNKLPDFVDSDDVLNSIGKWEQEKKISTIFDNVDKEVRDVQDSHLQQQLCQLEDEVESLKDQVIFWKSRCAHWRSVAIDG